MNPMRGRRWRIPRTAVGVAVSVAADYERRKKEIALMKPDDPRMQVYTDLNRAVDSALESVEVKLRPILLDDIASGRGYGRSRALTMISKPTYYLRRERVIHDIAVNLKIS